MSRNPQGEPRTAEDVARLIVGGFMGPATPRVAREDAIEIVRQELDKWRAEAAAPVEGLRAALEPFVRSANGRTPGYHGDRRVYTLQINESTVERAAAALRAIESPAHPERRCGWHNSCDLPTGHPGDHGFTPSIPHLPETRHPYTCGTCRWEGPTRAEYLAHCVAARHDNHEAAAAALADPAP